LESSAKKAEKFAKVTKITLVDGLAGEQAP
jgi:hypothetical protein